jgi:hypothetical protein
MEINFFKLVVFHILYCFEDVGAIEAEQAMLGQPFYFQIPKIICIRLMSKYLFILIGFLGL